MNKTAKRISDLEQTVSLLKAQLTATLNAFGGLAVRVSDLEQALDAVESAVLSDFHAVDDELDDLHALIAKVIEDNEPSIADIIEIDERKLFVEVGLDDSIEYLVERDSDDSLS